MSFTKIDLMFNQTDHYGNVLEANEIQEGQYAVRLKQANEQRFRELGQLQETESGFRYLKNEKEEDKLYKTKAWSVHAKILGFCDEVVYVTNKARYRISAKEAKKHSTLASFDNTSNTTKAIIPIRHWEVELNDPKQERILNYLGYEWFDELKDEFSLPYMQQIGAFIAKRRKQTIVYPERDKMFRAFKQTPFMDVKVVIIGDEPYRDGSANGLAFGINPETVTVCQALQNINTELENDIYQGFSLFKRTTLEEWSSQGVLLLNTCLSSESSKYALHANIGWQKFTATVVQRLINRAGKPIVFMLWGERAYEIFHSLISNTKNLILFSIYPGEAKEKPGYFGCKHFSKCNQFLKVSGQSEIVW